MPESFDNFFKQMNIESILIEILGELKKINSSLAYKVKDSSSIAVSTDPLQDLLFSLSPKEQLVFIARVGIGNDKPMSFKEIAKLNGVNVSPGTASRIYRKVVRKCRHPNGEMLAKNLDPILDKKFIDAVRTS